MNQTDNLFEKDEFETMQLLKEKTLICHECLQVENYLSTSFMLGQIFQIVNIRADFVKLNEELGI